MDLYSLLGELFVEIPKGAIEMRDDRIKSQWKVNIQPFFLSKFPVTQELYQIIVGENPSTFKGNKHPVETVSWVDAVLFCNKLSSNMSLESCYVMQESNEKVVRKIDANGFRLPTEAEWQYACQAGSYEKRYDELDKIAWYKENSNGGTQEVGEKKPNGWGAYDMLGNIWEWCDDLYDETVYGSYRIFRGGGWSDEERGVMATNRRRSHPSAFKIDDLGFRIAKNKN